ncbi:MAG: GNAT family protein [Oscillospiraceae bacterium]|nr:GNAT family protein [Oscillospiraceae bacterium]
MEGFVRLETQRLRLRDHLAEDLPEHHRLLSDPLVMRYLPELRTHTLAESEENLRQAMAQVGRPERTGWFFRIEEKESGRLVGEIGYTVVAQGAEGKTGHLGYFTFCDFWGRGYVPEAMAEVLRFGFEEGGIALFETGCLAENRRSERVMQKCGMRRREGEFRERHEGELKPRVEYVLRREDWAQGRTDGAKEA